MTRLAAGYLAYLVISVGITRFVGKALHRHGRLFVIDALHGHVRLAETVNDLLLVGFYLLNLSLALFLLRSNAPLADGDVEEVQKAEKPKGRKAEVTTTPPLSAGGSFSG